DDASLRAAARSRVCFLCYLQGICRAADPRRRDPRSRSQSSNVETLAAATAALLVRIAKDKARLQLLLDVIHLGAEDEHDGFRVDQHGYTLVFDDLVEPALLVGIFDRVAEARAAAGPHPDAHPQSGLAARRQER